MNRWAAGGDKLGCPQGWAQPGAAGGSWRAEASGEEPAGVTELRAAPTPQNLPDSRPSAPKALLPLSLCSMGSLTTGGRGQHGWGLVASCWAQRQALCSGMLHPDMPWCWSWASHPCGSREASQAVPSPPGQARSEGWDWAGGCRVTEGSHQHVVRPA